MTTQASNSDKTYNGWKNWETWNVALWFANEEPLYRKVLAHMRKYGKFTTAAAAREFVRLTLPRGTPDFPQPPGFHLYDAVDWQAIVEDFNEMGDG